MTKYEFEISNYIDSQNPDLSLGEEEDLDDFINKITARELSYKCMYFNSKYPFGDRNVSDDYIKDILDDYFSDNVERHHFFVAVDNSKKKSYITDSLKKNMSNKSSREKRRLKKRYSYDNPFHRIHGILITQDNPCKCPPSFIYKNKKKKIPKISALTVICANPFASKAGIKAVGSFLLLFYLFLHKKAQFDYSVLEVANDHATRPDYEVDEEDYNREDLEDLTIIDLKDILRENNLSISGKKDILIERILTNQESQICKRSYSERMEIEEGIDEDDLDLYGYGGIYYHQGRDEQKDLYCNFYERVGYKENSKINTDWNCFQNIPYPSMILNFNHQSYRCLADIFINRKWKSQPTQLCDYGKKKNISKYC